MTRYPQDWFDTNKAFLEYFFQNKVIQGKKAFVSAERLTKWLINNITTSNLPEYLNAENLETKITQIISEMVYYKILSRTRSASVVYISPEDDYFELKKKLTEDINKKLPSTETNTIDNIPSAATTLQHIYSKINTFSGDGKEFLKDLPKLIDLAARVVYDPRTEWKLKSILTSVLGYILIGNNTPEEDYFDDLFAISFALKHVDNCAGYLLEANWTYEGGYKKILNDAYQNSRIVVSDKESREILHLLGIPNLIKIDGYCGDYELLGLVSYLMGELYNSAQHCRTIQYAENKLLSLGKYDDVKRILYIASGELVPKSRAPKPDDILDDEEYNLILANL